MKAKNRRERMEKAIDSSSAGSRCSCHDRDEELKVFSQKLKQHFDGAENHSKKRNLLCLPVERNQLQSDEIVQAKKKRQMKKEEEKGKQMICENKKYFANRRRFN